MSDELETADKCPRSHLERLDKLIEKFLNEITEHANEHAKVGDLLKMIELRYKLMPDRSDQKQFWEMIDRIRKDQLPRSSTRKKTGKASQSAGAKNK